MKTVRLLVFNQNSYEAEDLAIKNGTTTSMCGYAVCGLCEYLSEQPSITEQTLKKINFWTLKGYIERAMLSIKENRKKEIEKFSKKMSEKEKKNYLSDWVATFEIADYLQSISHKFINKECFFFRQCSYCHPEAMKTIKFEEAERVKEEAEFKDHKYFYSTFNPYKNNQPKSFSEEIQILTVANVPIIIPTDILGHFNVTILMGGNTYVLDSLSSEGKYDEGILEEIIVLYKKSFLEEND